MEMVKNLKVLIVNVQVHIPIDTERLWLLKAEFMCQADTKYQACL